MKPNVILDTNILLDLFYFEDESVAYLRKCIKNQEIQAFTCTSIWEEFEEVLARKPFSQTQEHILYLRQEYQAWFTWKTPEKMGHLKCSDPDDQVFIDLAMELAPILIITKDNDLLKMKKRLETVGVQALQQFPEKSTN